jgi:large subunit ribosomal protein L6
VSVKGPKGNLAIAFDPAQITVDVNDESVQVGRRHESKIARSLHGLIRSLVANAVTGVTSGFQKRLDVYGVGFRADVQGRKLTLEIGYSHSVIYEAPDGVEIATEDGQGGAQARIVVSGIDKQKVGQVAADIRFKRKPEPYKGKGIRYHDEVIHFKAGKSAVS